MRQPILDSYGLVHGYELLFKAGPKEYSGSMGHNDVLTIMDNIVLSGLGRLTGGLPTFFNCTTEALTLDLVAVLPPFMTVLEISASSDISPELLETCHKLKRAGFRFALVGPTESPEPHPLLDIIDYVKMDSACLTTDSCGAGCSWLKGAKVAMVASGIHSQDSYRKARAEGFKYFQGFYFCNPEPLQNATIPANQLVHIQILHELLIDPLELKRLCPLVLRDASLVYHVLRLVNSPAYAVRESINSIESAIILLGDIAFRRIATLAIQCALNKGRPRELLHMALVRARFCSESAWQCNLDPNEQYLLGMLSLLPAMLSVPMETIVPELPLRDTLSHALLGFPIHERCLLDWIECHESNNVSGCRTIAEHYGLNQSLLMQAYVDALVWDAADPVHSVSGNTP